MNKARILFATCLLLVAPLSAHAAHHKDKAPSSSALLEQPQLAPTIKPLYLAYDIYVGGVQFISAHALFQQQEGHYRVDVAAETHGLWHRWLPWGDRLHVDGTIKGDRFLPDHYMTRDIWKETSKATFLTYAPDRAITISYDPAQPDAKDDKVTAEQRLNALDPVSALVQLLATNDASGNCNIGVPVFDGKRRFDLKLQNLGRDDIDEDGYNAFKGNAHVCEAGFDMIAGDWKEGRHSRFWERNDKEQGRAPFQIWLGKLAPDVPELPVRLESESVWGLIVMHMSGWHYATADELKLISN